MKKIFLTIVAMLTIAVSADAMSYEQARREALFLTDKMAYELNLSDEQYEAAYEINLDYLMGVTSRDDVYGTYWTRRNLDFSYILFDWQWTAFQAATYFYRPLYWSAGYWHFAVYARYPHRHYFYFNHPTVYVSYCGGHSWRSNGGHSYYHGHRHIYHGNAGHHTGLRDRWDRGDYPRTGTANHGVHSGRQGAVGGNGSFGNRRTESGDRSNGNGAPGNRRTESGDRSNGNSASSNIRIDNGNRRTDRGSVNGRGNGASFHFERAGRSSSTRVTARPNTGASREESAVSGGTSTAKRPTTTTVSRPSSTTTSHPTTSSRPATSGRPTTTSRPATSSVSRPTTSTVSRSSGAGVSRQGNASFSRSSGSRTNTASGRR